MCACSEGPPLVVSETGETPTQPLGGIGNGGAGAVLFPQGEVQDGHTAHRSADARVDGRQKRPRAIAHQPTWRVNHCWPSLSVFDPRGRETAGLERRLRGYRQLKPVGRCPVCLNWLSASTISLRSRIVFGGKSSSRGPGE